MDTTAKTFSPEQYISEWEKSGLTPEISLKIAQIWQLSVSTQKIREKIKTIRPCSNCEPEQGSS